MRQATGVAQISCDNDALWAYASANGRRRSVEAGAVLFERDDAARYMFFVLSGRLDVFRNDGRWRVAWSRAAGDVVSFDCDGRRELSCRAAADTELIAVERRVVSEHAQHDRAITQRLADLHAEELRIVLSTLGDSSRMKVSNVIDLVVHAARNEAARPPRRRQSLQRRPVPQVSRA